MELMINGIHYNVELLNESKKRTVVFLHGFTGSTKTWQSVIEQLSDYKVVLIDLLGHGKTGSPETPDRFDMKRQVEDLETIFDHLSLTDFALIGYSMGGRTALAYACTYPKRLRTLVLESASPGLQAEEAQAERRQRDSVLADRIIKDGVPAFVDFWQDIALFESQKQLPKAVQHAVREERLNQNPLGLANSLLGMGTGSQQSYWSELESLQMPVLLLAGELDSKFKALGEEMFSRLPNGSLKIIEAGHAIHVEKPFEFATMVEEYLTLEFQGGKS